MKIVCISDTHGAHRQIDIPDGDILIHAGDFSSEGQLEEIIQFNHWLGSLPHTHKIIIAGNHDLLFEAQPKLAQSLISNAIYLEDSGVNIEGLKIWGSPITPFFCNWAFNRQRGEEIAQHWRLIPKDIDILITHGPPAGILDLNFQGEAVGCEVLGKVVNQIQPRVHLFGHIHEAYGEQKSASTHFVNASIMNLAYLPVHYPIVLEV